jgi:ribonuclease Z
VRTIFHPFLPNGPFGDPVVWIDLLDEGRSVLLDLGDLRAIPNRKLLRVDRVVVTHTHMDHFIGFDHLLRLVLPRERELAVTGPRGFLGQVRGRIAAYTWNVIDDYPVCLVAEEIDGDTIRSERYTGASRMLPERLPDRPFTGTVHAHRAFIMQVDMLDHDVPVLGVAVAETEHLAVDKDRLLRMGLEPGPWLAGLKAAVRSRAPEDTPVVAPLRDGGSRSFGCAELAGQLLSRTPGQRIAYLTDFGCTAANLERAARLAADADLLICEAAFLHEDVALASERHHLTARQAGELARQAGARRLAPFHFSARYGGREAELYDEAEAAFGGPIVQLPPI